MSRRSTGLARSFCCLPAPPPPPPPPQPAYSHLLRSCSGLRHVRQAHAHLTVLGALSSLHHPATCTLLLNAYSSLHDLPSAHAIFDSLESPSVVQWNSMIRAYAGGGQHDTAIGFYRKMLDRGVHPDNYTFTFVLKACAGVSDPEVGATAHSEVVRRGLEGDVYIRTALIDFYCRLGVVETARELFACMPQPDIVTWNSMIAGFSQSGDPYDALCLFRRMQRLGVKPSSVSLLNLFPAVCKLLAGSLCKELHGFVIRSHLCNSVCNGLIDAYSKCGDIASARRVFDGMLGNRDAISWGTMISGYVQNDHFTEALELFDDLRTLGAGLNSVSVVSAILAATEVEDLKRGVDAHAYATLKGVDGDAQVVTALVTMYVKCNNIEKARELFYGSQHKDRVAWSALISAFAQSGHPKEALSVFLEMQEAGVEPNHVTLLSVLPACMELLDSRSGKSIHSYALRSNIVLNRGMGSALVALYAKCGCFSSAHTLFDNLPHKDTVTWNALINSYTQRGDAMNAMNMFCRLQSSGFQPDYGTMVGILPACALLNILDQGMAVHGLALKSGLDYDHHVQNAVIDMYSKCGKLEISEVLFNEFGCSRDIVSWNTMIAGFMHNGHAEKAIFAFHQLKTEGLKPNLVTLVSILPAAAYLAALQEGMAFHSCIIRTGFELHLVVGNSLIDMYSKCGKLDYAQEVFDQMEYRDTVTWNAMITGYAINGLGEKALQLFSQMQESNVVADKVSFVGILSACRHGGLVEEGRTVFESMKSRHHYEPKLEHYACMVDLLGRAGRLREAWDLIQKMPMKPDASVWGAFLDACKMRSNIKMGNMAVNYLTSLESQNAAPYVALSNTYAELGRWSEARCLRKAVRQAGLSKTPGCSWL